jgi:hypothetical protein
MLKKFQQQAMIANKNQKLHSQTE